MDDRNNQWTALTIVLAVALVAGWTFYSNKVNNLETEIDSLDGLVRSWEEDWREIGMTDLSLEEVREVRQTTVPVLLARTEGLPERLDQRYARGLAKGRLEMCDRIYGAGLSAIVSLEDGNVLTYRDCRFYA